eukprot:m.81713 g.81713  ORF g.81713 m.81713 type:complete len:142 (-) comp14701_c1_seq4:118-543(-)
MSVVLGGVRVLGQGRMFVQARLAAATVVSRLPCAWTRSATTTATAISTATAQQTPGLVAPRFIPPVRRLDLVFGHGSSSNGMRAFLEQDLAELAKQHPTTRCCVRQKPSRHPCLTAHYRKPVYFSSVVQWRLAWRGQRERE